MGPRHRHVVEPDTKWGEQLGRERSPHALVVGKLMPAMSSPDGLGSSSVPTLDGNIATISSTVWLVNPVMADGPGAGDTDGPTISPGDGRAPGEDMVTGDAAGLPVRKGDGAGATSIEGHGVAVAVGAGFLVFPSPVTLEAKVSTTSATRAGGR